MVFLKLSFLVLAIWFISVVLLRTFKNQGVHSMTFFIMSVSIVGFLYLQFDFLK